MLWQTALSEFHRLAAEVAAPHFPIYHARMALPFSGIPKMECRLIHSPRPHVTASLTSYDPEYRIAAVSSPVSPKGRSHRDCTLPETSALHTAPALDFQLTICSLAWHFAIRMLVAE